MNQSRCFRFGLRSMFLAFVPVAIGCTVVRELYRPPDVGALLAATEGVLAAATSWIVMGLASEIGRLFSLRTQLQKQNREARFGWILAIVWQCVLIIILASFWIVRVLVNRNVLAYTEAEQSFNYTAYGVHHVLFFFALLCAIGGSWNLNREAGRWSRTVNLLAGFCGAFLVVFIVWEMQTIPFRVHLATSGILQAESARFAGPYDNLPLSARNGPFITRAFTLAALVPMCLLAIRQFAGHSRSIGWRFGWFVFILAGLVTQGVSLYWLGTQDYVRVNEGLAGAFIPIEDDTALAAIGLVVLLSAVIAHRLTARPFPADEDYRRETAESVPLPFHRQGWVLGILSVGAGANVFYELYNWGETDWRWILFGVFSMPEVAAATALFFASLVYIWRSIRGRSIQHEYSWLSISPARFVIVFLATCTAIPFAVATLAAVGFALWLVRWYDAPWIDWLIQS